MRKISNIILIAFFLFFTFACAVKTSSIRLKNFTQRPVIPANQITIYQTANEVPFKYEEIGLISAKGSMVWTTKSKMELKMRTAAGRLGANQAGPCSQKAQVYILLPGS